MAGGVNNNRYDANRRPICPQDNTRVAPKQVHVYQPPKPNSIHTQAKKQGSKPTVEPLSIDGQKPFDTKTTTLINQKYNHKTKLLDIAQANLGLVEVTATEYAKLSAADRKKTQGKIICDIVGNKNLNVVNHQWCAYTVSYMAKEAGMDIGGSKAQVSQFIKWAQGKGTYRAITSHKITAQNVDTERKNRAAQIKTQLPKMHEGDFIIWKNDYATRTSNAGLDFNQSSHIGIIEKVDTKRGVVTVIEGNANESIDPSGSAERVKITSRNKSTLGVNGNQIEDEYQEVNRRDGLIRKEYTIQDLANFGYSGYIDNSKIVK